ncbi:bifunctional adenosylcobinamide kinase/adenosylcobinamide-phosphate guanylyltransferase [Wenxinia saemankumensis]|uniref:Bifunctional adenosylcobalamin biosynthesis protein n=1 Tax=Wenxinia saemankumensis TaxID=1447782 RepID=A0A1M6FHS9_9RHOB|nr:bifunctional adenosylcobinamide kinase/adenosylcobinamide-phosphate guanylyltransferase [Wenxinia saemankumensis]SHI97213.1 adenosylcobinamide kinase /adenosylcobinamide-phosphate guanylyltransferase [Wenxinia saemankumensis]
MSLQKFSLVLGGAASGKSSYAEALVTQSDFRPVYVATAEAHDDEMRAKIAAHRDARAGRGWVTIEESRNVAARLTERAPDEAVLIDCATLWLTNVLLAGGDVEAEGEALLAGIAACAAPVVLVSNEVGAGIVPETALGRRFRAAQGRLNQRAAAAADLVVLVTAGLPLALKGTLP